MGFEENQEVEIDLNFNIDYFLCGRGGSRSNRLYKCSGENRTEMSLAQAAYHRRNMKIGLWVSKCEQRMT